MKTLMIVLILFGLVILPETVVPSVATAQTNEVVYPLKLRNTKAAKSGDGVWSIPRYLKRHQTPLLWNPVDTSEWFPLALLQPGDTLVAYYWKSTGARYYGRVMYQFAHGADHVKAAVHIDSIKRVGGAAVLVSSTADSIVVGQPLWHRWMTGRNTGADRVRLLFVKDTTNTPTGDATLEMGVIVRRKSEKPKQ